MTVAERSDTVRQGARLPDVPRRLWGALQGLVLPILLVAADTVGRLVVQPGELEAGLVVAFLGAPVMVALVRATRTGAL